jgi:general secretion pathway protein J
MRKGFSLIEVMIAVAVLATVSTLVWGTFQGTFKTKSAVEAQAIRYRTVRVALERLSREISQAYVSQNEDTGQQDRRTLFVGKHKSDIDELKFSYFGHQRLYADADECDTAQIYYYGVRDRENSRKLNLVRRETRRLQYLKPENAPGEADIVCDDVVRLEFKYWDARDKQWREDWVTTSADGQPDRLPSRVKITLTVRDERGKDVPFQTEVRIAISEPLNLRALPDVGGTGVGGVTGTTGGTGPKTGTNPAGGVGTTPAANPFAPRPIP